MRLALALLVGLSVGLLVAVWWNGEHSSASPPEAAGQGAESHSFQDRSLSLPYLPTDLVLQADPSPMQLRRQNFVMAGTQDELTNAEPLAATTALVYTFAPAPTGSTSESGDAVKAVTLADRSLVIVISRPVTADLQPFAKDALQADSESGMRGATFLSPAGAQVLLQARSISDDDLQRIASALQADPASLPAE